jgi:hypothetical protein
LLCCGSELIRMNDEIEMKRISYILLLIMTLIVCSAKDCADGGNMRAVSEEERIVALKDNVKTVFEADSLGDEFRSAYEETARQKLIDFADYLKIISDTSLDINFRQQARAMASKLFISDGVDLHNWSKIYSKPGLNTLEKLLDTSLSLGLDCWVQPFQIVVDKPLTRKNDSTFAGNLSFYQRKISLEGQVYGDNKVKMYRVDFYVMRKAKPFGDEQLRIWAVFLGDI